MAGFLVALVYSLVVGLTTNEYALAYKTALEGLLVWYNISIYLNVFVYSALTFIQLAGFSWDFAENFPVLAPVLYKTQRLPFMILLAISLILIVYLLPLGVASLLIGHNFAGVLALFAGLCINVRIYKEIKRAYKTYA